MRLRSAALAALMLISLLATSCGGGGSGLIITGLVAFFSPTATPSADPRISLETGAAAGDVFRVEVHANNIDEIAGVAFTMLYDPVLVEYLSCDAKDSILLFGAPDSNPCDGAMVAGAAFNAALENGTPGILNVGASLQGLVAGVPGGNGRLITLTFQALGGGTSDFDFEAGPSREVQTCDLANCVIATVNWDGGTLNAINQ